MLKPKLVTPPNPAVPLLSVDEAKTDLRILTNDHDALIARLIHRASALIDGYSGILGRAVIRQTWSQSFPLFSDIMRLPLGPFVSLDGVTYYDQFNALRTLDDLSLYLVLEDHRGPFLRRDRAYVGHVPSVYNRPDAVTVTWTCGMAETADEVDPRIKAAVSLIVGHLFLNPEHATVQRHHPIAISADDMLAPLRAML